MIDFEFNRNERTNRDNAYFDRVYLLSRMEATKAQQDHFCERVAIMIHEGGLTEGAAKAAALLEIMKKAIDII